jgi:RNA polymerase sigma factor (sigma-70 family)
MQRNKGSYEVDRFDELLEGLEPEARRVLTLRYKHDMTPARVAAELLLDVDEVLRIEASALRKLREEMNTP